MSAELTQLRQSCEKELVSDILPFWASKGFRKDGYMTGVITNDLREYDDVPRHVVLCARILWTFAAGYRVNANPTWLEAGRKALALLNGPFWDKANGGVVWALDAKGGVSSDRKQIYAEAFTIYGLAEWYAATGDMAALARAQEIYRLIEKNARDPKDGGYIEALSASWGQLEDMRLSHKDLNSPKSMNTLLHVMEAFAGLLRVWPDAGLRASLKDLVTVLIDKVYTTEPFPRFALFFDMQWKSLNNKISYGHDIETSWLLWDAAEAVGDKALMDRVRPIALDMAKAVLANGVDTDGSIFYDGDATGVLSSDKHWWPQAEAVVGFFNAWQLSGDKAYLDTAIKTWNYIDAKVVDHKHGEWFALLRKDGTVAGDYEQNPDYCKIGPWKCPYHNGRAAIEMMKRIKA